MSVDTVVIRTLIVTISTRKNILATKIFQHSLPGMAAARQHVCVMKKMRTNSKKSLGHISKCEGDGFQNVQ